jgi:hypothetical protein
MNILSFFYNIIHFFIFIFGNFNAPNVYQIDCVNIDDIEYISSHDPDLIMNDIQIEEVEEMPHLIQQEENRINEIMPNRTNRRCGYCREVGHNVTNCTSENIVRYQRELQEFINNQNTTPNSIRLWMNNITDIELKVLLCKLREINYNSSIVRNELEHILLEHVRQMVLNRNTLNNIINAVNELVTDYGNELQIPAFNISNENMYKKLSIATSEVLNNSEDIICPICYDSIEKQNICKTDCNHEFCKDCVNKTLKDKIEIKNHSECPLCRNTIKHLFFSTSTH